MTKPKTISKVGRFAGKILYSGPGNEDETKIPSVIFRPNGEIAFDFDFGTPGNPYNYTVILAPKKNSLYEGKSRAGKAPPYEEGKVTARLYSNEEGHVLKGSWFEGGSKYEWIAELCAPAHG